MHLHSTLDGRAGEFHLRGAAWELDSRALRGFLYLIPVRRDGNGRYRVIEATGDSLWSLLDALSQEVSSITGSAVKRLDARAVAQDRRPGIRSPNRGDVSSRSREAETR
jgi:hypothetical protein